MDKTDDYKQVYEIANTERSATKSLEILQAALLRAFGTISTHDSNETSVMVGRVEGTREHVLLRINWLHNINTEKSAMS